MWTQECIKGEVERRSGLAPVHGGDARPRPVGRVEVLPSGSSGGAGDIRMSQGETRLRPTTGSSESSRFGNVVGEML